MSEQIEFTTHNSQTSSQYNQQKKYKMKRFHRKPIVNTSRSHSKNSDDSSASKSSYIRTPRKQFVRTSINNYQQLTQLPIQQPYWHSPNYVKSTRRKERLFDDSPGSFTKDNKNKTTYTVNSHKDRQKHIEKTQDCNWVIRVRILQAEIDMKNHQLLLLSSQSKQAASLYHSQKQRRKKTQQQLHILKQQQKIIQKQLQNSEQKISDIKKQREYLFKQIQFLQKINNQYTINYLNQGETYDKMLNMQTYREEYLQNKLEQCRIQLQKNHSQRQSLLTQQLHTCKSQYYILQSQYKAMKVANQVLLKKLYTFDEQLHETIINSSEYKLLRQKYIKFLDQYKQLRNQYWTLKAQCIDKENINAKLRDRNNNTSSAESIFQLTASDNNQYSFQNAKF